MLAGRKAALDLATADLGRYQQLSDNVVSREKARAGAGHATAGAGRLDQALADRDLAKLNLDRSEVKASVHGTITNMDLRPGAYVTAGKGVMALVDRDTLHVDGYFEETKLPRIKVGDPVPVHLWARTSDLTGHVESIAGGIEDRERSRRRQPARQRQPELHLGAPGPARAGADRPRQVPEGVQLITGRTATVEVNPGETRSFGWDRLRTVFASP